MPDLVSNLRLALRSLGKNRGTNLLAVLALGLGIGLTTVMFSVVYGVLLRGLPFEQPERLIHLEQSHLARDEPSLEVSLPDFLEWQQQQTSFEALAGYYDGTINVGDDTGFPERFEGAFLSAATFDLLRVKPRLGRGFRAGEDTPGAAPVVILSDKVWHGRYGGDPEIVGRTLRINGEPSEVIGVMPEGFAFPENQEIWVPLRRDPLSEPRGDGLTLEVIGRLKPGVTLEQARAELAAIVERQAATYPETNAGYAAVVKPLVEEYIDDELRNLLWIMLAAVTLVLLLACANVASLLLARATTRIKEIALRTALGAGRGRIIRQMLAESVLLAVPGALLGLAIANGGIDLVNRALEWDRPPFWISIALHPPVFVFALGATLVAAIAAGLVPALQASRVDVNDILKEEGRGGSAGLSISRANRLIVITEVAFACVLLVFSALMVRSVMSLRNLDLGVEVERVMTARIGLFESKYPEASQRLELFERLVERLAAQPGVESAALTSGLPASGSDGSAYEIEGRSYPDRRDIPDTRLAVVTPGFFETFEIPLLKGRLFGSQDRPETAPVVIVNRSFSERNWPGEDPLGRRIRLGRGDAEESWRTIVGVVPDARLGSLDDEEQDGIYVPLTQLDRQFISIAVRTTSPDPASAAPLLRETVLALDRDQPIYWVRTMARAIFEEAFFFNFFATLFLIFGLAALVLAAVGIYGVMAFSVGQRSHEIGIRMALGARREDVLGMVLRQGSGRLAIGLGIGLAIAFAGSRFLGAMLFEIEPADPAAFLITALFLTAVTLFACWVPAQRAARIDPTQALRE